MARCPPQRAATIQNAFKLVHFVLCNGALGTARPTHSLAKGRKECRLALANAAAYRFPRIHGPTRNAATMKGTIMMTRRKALKLTSLTTAACAIALKPHSVMAQAAAASPSGPFKVPPLPYSYDALE